MNPLDHNLSTSVVNSINHSVPATNKRLLLAAVGLLMVTIGLNFYLQKQIKKEELWIKLNTKI